MTTSTVQINYREAQRLAEAIEQRSQEFRRFVEIIETKVAAEMEACWMEEEGAFAPSKVLVSDLRAHLANLNAQADTLNSLAHAMSRTADLYRMANEK